MHLSAPRSRTLLAGLLTVPVLLVASGCSGSVSIGSTDPVVKQSKLEEQISAFYTDQGAASADVTCPGDLTGKVDNTIDCDAVIGDQMSRATLTVTSVDGTDVNFDVTPTPILSAEQAATTAANELAEQVGEAAPDITCPDQLVGAAGETLVCSLAVGDEAYDTTLTVTGNDGGSVQFDVQVADTPS